MLKRTITAVVLVSFLMVMVFYVRQFWLGAGDMTIALFGLVGTYELAHSLNTARDEQGNKRFNIMIAPIVLGMILVAPLSIYFAMTGLFMSILFPTILALIIMTFRHEKYALKDLFATVFTLIYPMAIMAMFFILNRTGNGEILSLFLVIAIAVLEDTCAYLVGVTVKGPKLCPSISPKKTISGAIGGVLGGMLGAVVTFLMFDYAHLFDSFGNVTVTCLNADWRISIGIYLAVGLVGGIVGELGDLGASAIKRKLGIKDYGKIFPGHGGFMDRIDSFVFVLPVVFVMCYFAFMFKGF